MYVGGEVGLNEDCMGIGRRHVALQRQQNSTSGSVLRGRWDIIALNSRRRHGALHLLGEFARGIQEQSRLMPQEHPRRGTRG
jgi:hypothetical protein